MFMFRCYTYLIQFLNHIHRVCSYSRGVVMSMVAGCFPLLLKQVESKMHQAGDKASSLFDCEK